MNAGKAKQEYKTKRDTKKRGRKPNSSMKLIELSDSPIGCEEFEKLLNRKNDQSKEGHDAPCEDPPSMEAVVPPENEKMTHTQLSSSKVLENESSFVASPLLGRSLPNESHFKKIEQPRKKDNLNQEVRKRVGSKTTNEDKTHVTMIDSVKSSEKKLGET